MVVVLFTFVFWFVIFSVAIFKLRRSAPVKKMGFIGQFGVNFGAGCVIGLLLAMFEVFPGDYGIWIAMGLAGLASIVAEIRVECVETKERQEKLDWFVNTDNEKVVAFRKEMYLRATLRSYESMGQKQDDLKRLGTMLDDHDLARTYLTELVKEGVSKEKEEAQVI